jgi:hypothetical protein
MKKQLSLNEEAAQISPKAADEVEQAPKIERLPTLQAPASKSSRALPNSAAQPALLEQQLTKALEEAEKEEAEAMVNWHIYLLESILWRISGCRS